ncbi:hypothetical protein D9758_002118 [Tetrapyrgos nigripes]|uniref:Transcription factor domain-containing protein n=1 Tax=Tetrapyrgos nigripes TaxID=182062 RepID=A0A8H5GTG6_9AGAR|nr:hypothetical protein D9758_002118 [Tetrapyrgos nigripes]
MPSVIRHPDRVTARNATHSTLFSQSYVRFQSRPLSSMSSSSTPPSQASMLGSFSVQEHITVPVRERVRSSRACRLCRKQKAGILVGNAGKLGQIRTCKPIRFHPSSSVRTQCIFESADETPPSLTERTTALESRMATIEAELAQTKSLLDRLMNHQAHHSSSSPPTLISPIASKSLVASSPAASISSAGSHPKITPKPATPSGSLARILTSTEDEISSDSMVTKHQLPKQPLKRPRVDSVSAEDPLSPIDIYAMAENKECNLAFVIFSRRCSAYLPFFDPDQQYAHFCQSTESQTLFWAVIGTGSREAEELSNLHSVALSRATKWVQASLYAPPCTLDDLKGLLIYIQWLATPRPVGHAVGLAYELNLHRSGSQLLSLLDEISNSTDDGHMKQRELAKVVDEVRTYAYLFVTDQLLSFASGKPAIMTEGNLAAELRAVVSLPTANAREGRILAQIELLSIINGVKKDIIGAGSPTTPLNPSVLELLRVKNMEADDWHTRWQAWATRINQGSGVFTMSAAISINYVWGKMQMNCMTLHGVKQATDFSPTRLQYLAEAVKYAMELVVIGLENFKPPLINYASNFTQLQITFGAVFCLKIIRLLPGRFDEHQILGLAADTAVLMSYSSKSKQLHELLLALLEQFQNVPPSSYLREINKSQPIQHLPAGAPTGQPLHNGVSNTVLSYPQPQHHIQAPHLEPQVLENANFWNWSQSMPINGLDGFFVHNSYWQQG